MSIPLTVNGQVFEYPQNFDTEWGVDATGWAQAVTNGLLQMSGGPFPLTAQVNFGPNFGITTLDVISTTSNPASAGFIRLAQADTIAFRNNANTGNLLLGIDGSNNLTFNGIALGTTTLTNTHIYVGNASNVPADVAMSGDATMANTGALTIANGAITDAKVNASAAIALTKLAAQTPNSAVIFDSSGLLVPSAVTSTQIGYLSTLTSNVQTQLGTYLPLAGGTMSGAISMASNKITSLANATVSGDVSNYGQLRAHIMLDVKEQGAKGDGSTDDTVAIQNAIDSLQAQGGSLFFSIGNYRITSTLQMRVAVNLIGTYSNGGGGDSYITQTGSAPVLTMADSGAANDQQRILIQGLGLLGGTSGIYAPNGGVGVTLRDFTIQGTSGPCIYWKGFIQEWFLEDVELIGGTYGIYHHEVGTGSPILQDKNHFYSLYVHGQSINGIYWDLPSGTATHNTFTDLRIVTVQQDGMVIKGAFDTLQIFGMSTESNGLGDAPVHVTTATTTGSTTVTVGDSTGLTTGVHITIKGAGIAGADFYGVVINNINSTTIVINAAPPTNVSGAELTTASSSDIVIGADGSFPQNITMVGANLGSTTVLYSVYVQACGPSSVMGVKTVRPFYDTGHVFVLAGAAVTLFRP